MTDLPHTTDTSIYSTEKQTMENHMPKADTLDAPNPDTVVGSVRTRRAFSVTVLTLFPEMYPGPLGASLLGKAMHLGLWSLQTIDLKTYGLGRYGSVDDTCYGGGAGMLMRPDVVDAAVRQAIKKLDQPILVYMTPRGAPMRQQHFKLYAESGQDMVILCGRYEGVDQRVLDFWQFREISLGDFVLCGGDIPAMALIEGCVRLLPGVLHNPESILGESFQTDLLEHPQYTRPQEWQGMAVPEVLISGHHGHIQSWKKEQSLVHTRNIRPDLYEKHMGKP